MRVTLMHNPKAGEGELDGHELVRSIERAGYEVERFDLKKDDWPAALDEPGDLIVVAGGDGSVAKVARRAAGLGLPMAILPLGTANNVAHSLGLAGTVEDLVSRWRVATPTPLDLGLAAGPWGEHCFIEAFGAGLIAQLIRAARNDDPKDTETTAEERIRRGVEMVLAVLRRSEARRWQMRLDGRDLTGDFVLIEAMNIGSVGPGLVLSPAADPGDGLLDVVSLDATGRDAFAAYLRGLLDGVDDPPPLRRERGRHLEMRFSDSDVHIDDELWPPPGEHAISCHDDCGIDVRLLRGAIEVLL